MNHWGKQENVITSVSIYVLLIFFFFLQFVVASCNIYNLLTLTKQIGYTKDIDIPSLR